METIRITLDGSEIELLPSFPAAKNLSEKYHGLLPLIDHLNIGSIMAATDIVFQALDPVTPEFGHRKPDYEKTKEHVYNAGLKYLAPHLVRYVISLMNGGKIEPEESVTDDA